MRGRRVSGESCPESQVASQFKGQLEQCKAKVPQLEQEEHSKWIKFLRLYLNFGIKLNQDNPAGELHGFGPSVRRKKLPLWSHLAQLFNIYFTLKLMTCLVLQYNYNRLLLELNQKVASTGHTNKSAAELDLELTVNCMEWLGNAYYNFGFAVEPVYLFAISMNYMGYARPLLYIVKQGHITFRLLRMFLEPHRERESFIRNDIENQIGRWLESSKNYMHMRREEHANARRRRCSAATQRVDCKLWLAHARNVRELNELAASGCLKPLNREREWVEQQVAKSYVKSTLITLLSSSAAACAILLVLPRANLVPAQLRNEPRDLLFQTELFVYCLWGIYSFNFHHMLPLVNAIDGIKFVTEIRQLVASLIKDAKLASLDGKPQQQLQVAPNHTPNLRLMRILIQYKLLKQQIRGTRALVYSLSTTMIITMLLAPAMVRYQIGHLSAELRYLYMSCCVLIILVCDFLTLPTCWLHARCMDLYRSMSFLLAQIDATTAAHQAARGTASEAGQLYDEHTVALLRREQNSPELAARQFASETYFMRLTYSNFIGIHFYCGLLLAPTLLRDTSSFLTGTTSLLTFL